MVFVAWLAMMWLYSVMGSHADESFNKNDNHLLVWISDEPWSEE